MSHFVKAEYRFEALPGETTERAITVGNGGIAYWFIDSRSLRPHSARLEFSGHRFPASPLDAGRILGFVAWKPYVFGLPFAVLTIALLPLAIVPFISFRFCIWHYLAYTALVAVELAYYLQWQE